MNDAEINEVAERYRSLLPAMEAFRLQFEGLLRVLLSSEDRPVHHVESRCKGVEEFKEKIVRKSYVDPMTQMTDLVGLRIILHFNSDVTFAAGLIRREFVVDEANSEDKRVPEEADRFGYGSYHLVVSLDERRSNLPEWQPFVSMKAEIQIRTVLQHAWAAVDRLLDYKQSPGLTDEGRRRMNRIAAILEGADEDFETVRVGEEQVRTAHEETAKPDSQLDPAGG